MSYSQRQIAELQRELHLVKQRCNEFATYIKVWRLREGKPLEVSAGEAGTVAHLPKGLSFTVEPDITGKGPGVLKIDLVDLPERSRIVKPR